MGMGGTVLVVVLIVVANYSFLKDISFALSFLPSINKVHFLQKRVLQLV